MITQIDVLNSALRTYNHNHIYCIMITLGSRAEHHPAPSHESPLRRGHESSPLSYSIKPELSHGYLTYNSAGAAERPKRKGFKRRDGENMAAFVSEGCGEGRKP